MMSPSDIASRDRWQRLQRVWAPTHHEMAAVRRVMDRDDVSRDEALAKIVSELSSDDNEIEQDSGSISASVDGCAGQWDKGAFTGQELGESVERPSDLDADFDEVG